MKITVSVKNAGKIIQVANTFFRKSTARLFKNEVRTRNIFENRKLICVEKEHYDRYQPQLSLTCSWYSVFLNNKNSTTLPILSIQSKYSGHCIPLYRGDTLEYKGTSLIITQMNHSSKGRVQPVVFQFVHKEFSSEQIQQELFRQFEAIISNANFNAQYLKEFNQENQQHQSEHSFAEDILSAVENAVGCQEYENEIELCSFEHVKVVLKRDLDFFNRYGFSKEQEQLFSYNVINEKGETLLSTCSYVEAGNAVYQHEIKKEVWC